MWEGPAPPASDGFAGTAVLSGYSPPAKTASSELRIFGLSELRKAPLSPELKRLNGQRRLQRKKDALIRDRPVPSLSHTCAHRNPSHSSSL